MSSFADAFSVVNHLKTMELTGMVTDVKGLCVLVEDLPLAIGSVVRMEALDNHRIGEVIGFDGERTVVMLMSDTVGIRRGDKVVSLQAGSMARVGAGLLGRVVNGLGRPIDGKGELEDLVMRQINPDPIDPMQRVCIDEPLGTGVKAIDGMLSVGRGQRLGIFAGPGVGKSTLLGMMAKNTDADVAVIALIGERGRELQDFLHKTLGQEGIKKAVVVCSTGDDSALLRVRAALYATTVAEYFRDQGKNVLFLMDSVTRFAQAQRQIGLAAGEPPTTRGYTPTVFSMLPKLMERCGRTKKGSITGFYAILVEGDDLSEPISDASMGILDGHIVLSRALANKAHWPAISVTESVSRVANDVIDPDHRQARDHMMNLLSAYKEIEELVNIGAYAVGSNPEADLSIAMQDELRQFLQQTETEAVEFADVRAKMVQLALSSGQKSQQLQQLQRQRQQSNQR